MDALRRVVSRLIMAGQSCWQQGGMALYDSTHLVLIETGMLGSIFPFHALYAL